jgi:endonuclease/exonuclease/phosphatase family metal-dependent hydrolase
MEINVLETIARDIIEKYSEKGDIIMMGDFNARTGSEEDLIISDDTSHVSLSDNQYVIDTAVGKRSRHDSHIDTRGKELLDMCISNQLRILNGRTFGDSFGAYSCYKPAGCSVVDYAIVSQHLLC